MPVGCVRVLDLVLFVPVHLKETVVSKPPVTALEIITKKNNNDTHCDWNGQAGVNSPSGDRPTLLFLSHSSRASL